ncbi:MAG: helix-turn-helix domain-containing protein [Sulfolobales archaeon]
MGSPLLFDQDVVFYNIRVKTAKNSFLGKVSELNGSRVLVNVYKLPGSDLYFIVALTYGREISKIIKQLMIDDFYLRKSKIVRIRVQKIDDLYVIYGLKRVCEFYKLAQDNDIHILSPYLFDKGSRDYLVLGSRDRMESYLKQLRDYYGAYNVEFNPIDSIEKFTSTIMKESMLNIILDKLTPSEQVILKKAFETGYFEYPKNAGQYEIGSYLGLSKVTISIHLRKAFKKIIKDFIQFIE